MTNPLIWCALVMTAIAGFMDDPSSAYRVLLAAIASAVAAVALELHDRGRR